MKPFDERRATLAVLVGAVVAAGFIATVLCFTTQS